MAPPRPRRHAAKSLVNPDKNEITELDLWNSMNAEGQAKTIRGLLDEGALSPLQIEDLANEIPEIMDMALADQQVEDSLIRVGNFARELVGDRLPPDGTDSFVRPDPSVGVLGFTEDDWARIRRGEDPPPGRFRQTASQSHTSDRILSAPMLPAQRSGPADNPVLPASADVGQPPVNGTQIGPGASEPFAILSSFLPSAGVSGFPPNAQAGPVTFSAPSTAPQPYRVRSREEVLQSGPDFTRHKEAAENQRRVRGQLDTARKVSENDPLINLAENTVVATGALVGGAGGIAAKTGARVAAGLTGRRLAGRPVATKSVGGLTRSSGANRSIPDQLARRRRRRRKSQESFDHNKYPTPEEKAEAIIVLSGTLWTATDEIAAEGGHNHPFDEANFAQDTYGEVFSPKGRAIWSSIAGQPIETIDDLANAIRSGRINYRRVKVEYIITKHGVLILNTRTAQALIRAGVPRSYWQGRNVTNNPRAQLRLWNQLIRLNLKLDRSLYDVRGVPSASSHGFGRS